MPAERTSPRTGSAELGHFLSSAVPDGAPHRARVEATFEQLLPELAFGGEAEEEPRDRCERNERSLDHHHGAREALVVQRRDAPRAAVLVERIEDAPGPQED